MKTYGYAGEAAGEINDLIEYMDEAQYEMTHGLVEYKKFESEEAMKDFAKLHPEWLEVHGGNKGHYLAYSKVQDICKEAVDKTSRHYNLNVNLAIDPQYGNNWASCH